jgi:hypothetical protein
MQQHPTPAQGAGGRWYTIPGDTSLRDATDRTLKTHIDLLSLGVFTYVFYLIAEGADDVSLEQIYARVQRANEHMRIPGALAELVGAGLLVEVRL